MLKSLVLVFSIIVFGSVVSASEPMKTDQESVYPVSSKKSKESAKPAAKPQMATQPQGCASRKEMTTYLATQYDEVPIILGLTNEVAGLPTGMLIFFSSRDRSTWTFAIAKPDGSMCIIRTGTDMITVIPEFAPKNHRGASF